MGQAWEESGLGEELTVTHNYEYIASVLEGFIDRNELDGTELHFFLLHKPAFESDYKRIVNLKKRFNKIEKHLRNLNQTERID